MTKLPEGWRTVQIEHLLSEEQIQMVLEIVNDKTDKRPMADRLREYLQQFDTELQAKGVLPAYLAYYLEAYLAVVRP